MKPKLTSKYKCSRCHKDMRIEGGKCGCDCIKTHPLAKNKSGAAFLKTNAEYHGCYKN